MPDDSPRIVFLILSHSRPQQLARLAKRLTADQAGSVVIHHDPTGAPIGGALAGVAGVELVPQPRAVRWGDFSQVEAPLASLAWLCETRDFDWVVVLSGQDYPVRPVHELAAHLEQTEFDGFIEGVEAPPPTRAGRFTGRGADQFSARYFFRYIAVRPSRITRGILRRVWPAPLLRNVPTGELLLGLPRARVPFGPNLRCMRGSDWYTLSFRSVETLLRAAREQPQLMRHFAQTFIPSEAFTHTILYAEPGLRLSGNTLRFVSWQPGAARPDVLRLADFERIVSSNAFFARKFDEAEDAEVLDALDERVASRP